MHAFCFLNSVYVEGSSIIFSLNNVYAEGPSIIIIFLKDRQMELQGPRFEIGRPRE